MIRCQIFSYTDGYGTYDKPFDVKGFPFNNWRLIHDSANPDFTLINPKLKIEKNKISQLTFDTTDETLINLINPFSMLYKNCRIMVVERFESAENPNTTELTNAGIIFKEDNVGGDVGHWWHYITFVGRVVNVTATADKDGFCYYSVICNDIREGLSASGHISFPYHLASTAGYGTAFNGCNAAVAGFINLHNNTIDANDVLCPIMYYSIDTSRHTNVTNEYQYDVNQETTNTILMERFVERFGGELYIDYANIESYNSILGAWEIKLGETTNTKIPLKWVNQRGVLGQSFEYAKNIKSLRITYNTDNCFVRLYPAGALRDDGSFVTLAQTTKYINTYHNSNAYTSVANALFKQWDDITIAENLDTTANAFISESLTATKNYNVEVIDISVNSETPQNRIRCSNRAKIKHSQIGFDHGQTNDTVEIVKVTYDLSKPQNISVLLGKADKSDTMQINNDISQIQNNLTKLKIKALGG